MSEYKKSNTESPYPLLPNSRPWGTFDLLMVCISTGVATWCFLEGGFVGIYLNAKMGMAAFTGGALIGLFLTAMAVITVTSKYGIDSITSSKPFLGNKGWIVALILQYISIIGWNATVLIFFAKATVRLFIETGVISPSIETISTSLLSVLAVIAVWYLLRQGSSVVQKVSVVLSILVMVVGFWMLYMIIKNFGIQAIMDAKPVAASPNRLWNYTAGIEIGLISMIVWWPYIGGMVRLAPKVSKATIPAIFGLALPVPAMATIGLFSILMIGDADPTAWMIQLGGPAYGSLALAFIALANFGAVVVGVYLASVGMQNLDAIRKKSWNFTTSISLIPIGLVGAFIPDLFFNSFGNFLTVLGVLFAPIIGIQIVDYFLFRKKLLNVKCLYDDSSRSSYAFWKGWNPASLLSLIIGFLCYNYLLNPLTYESHWLFQYMTATLPTMTIAAGSYWLLTKCVIIPLGFGGYQRVRKTQQETSEIIQVDVSS